MLEQQQAVMIARSFSFTASGFRGAVRSLILMAIASTGAGESFELSWAAYTGAYM